MLCEERKKEKKNLFQGGKGPSDRQEVVVDQREGKLNRARKKLEK